MPWLPFYGQTASEEKNVYTGTFRPLSIEVLWSPTGTKILSARLCISNPFLFNNSSFTDLGIILDSDLKFKEHILSRVKKANMMIGIMVRNFRHLSDFDFMGLYKSLVRSQLEYGVQVWSPYRQGFIDVIEEVQRATKLRQSCKDLSYQSRLEKLKLPSLCYRSKGALILLTSEIRDLVCPSLAVCTYTKSRGHEKKLMTRLAHKDCRKFFFGNRVVQEWNSLPQDVVTSQDVESFKKNLDRFFANRIYSLD